MLKFSKEVRRVYPGRRRSIFREVEESYMEAQRQRRPQLKAEDVSPVAKIPFKTSVLLQVALRRALELTESTVREINAHALVSSFVTSRALFETACLMFYTWKRVEAVLTSPSSPGLEELDDGVMQLLMGGRDKDWGGPVQAKNIQTVIDHVSKVFKEARKRYDALSEFAHPNYAGMLDIYQRLDNRRKRTVFIHPWKDNQGRLPLLMASVLESLTIINFALEKFKEHLPDFVRLCEEEIYGSGTWPKTLPY
jgi:hypothetical protein